MEFRRQKSFKKLSLNQINHKGSLNSPHFWTNGKLAIWKTIFNKDYLKSAFESTLLVIDWRLLVQWRQIEDQQSPCYVVNRATLNHYHIP